MTKRLMDVLNQINEVDTLQEIAEPIQQIVDMVNKGEIESYVLSVNKVHELSKGPYSVLNVKVHKMNAEPIAILGYGEASIVDLVNPSQKNSLSEESKNKLLSINSMLSAVNTYLRSSIPVNPNQRSGASISYYYSVARKELKNSWTEEDAKKWPMFPEFLENLINTDNVIIGVRKKTPT